MYEVAPGGGKTEDPSVAYDTVSAEAIYNVYQTLVAYNGSSTLDFVPELATCVPGSPLCTALYGSTLIQNNLRTGNPQYFTFVLDPGARFYDPSTDASWPVYPSDVMFTLSRTMGFADLPGVGVQNGWIQTQALTPYANGSWDTWIHSPYNNTPNKVLSSMIVNDSAYCPAMAMTQENGCITFDANGGGSDWPFFLELVADPLGAGIEPCGFFTHVGAGLPGFTGTGNANGDGPCLLPGGATSTNSTAFQHYLSTVSPTAWDAFQELADSNPQNPQPVVQWTMVGSGPYYTETITKAIGYVLKANPAYETPTGCAGQPGCEPLPGDYQGTVNTYWDDDDSAGLANYAVGQADLAGIELPSHVSTFTTLVNQGKIDFSYIPTLSIFFMPYDLNFNVSVTNTLPNNPSTTNVPGDFFAHVALRQFMTEAYPYATTNSTLLEVGGISTGFGYGGAIPKYLGNYYAYNISWPEGDPVLNPSLTGSAAWWWAQANNVTSLYYDSELAACTTSDPCTFPIIGEWGSTFFDSAILDLIGEIEALSGNRLMPYTFDITSFFDQDCWVLPCGNGITIMPWGWAPDYPDPTDYVTPMYLADSTFTFGDAVAETLSQARFNGASCPYVENWSDPSDAWTALVYYHGLQELPDACQGVAYNISNYWYTQGAPLTVGPQRTLDYQMASQLDYLLALYIWNFQEDIPESYASWINGATLNANPMIGGAGDNPWYSVGYRSPVSTVYLNETGLKPGSAWSATVGGVTHNGTGSSIGVQVPSDGSYAWEISFVQGYTVSNASGILDVTGPSSVHVGVTFTKYQGGVPLTFTSAGLITGVFTLSVLLQGLGQVQTKDSAFTITVPAGSYNYTATDVAGYNISGSPSGTIVVAASGGSGSVVYTSVTFFTSRIQFSEDGLPPGSTWAVTLNGFQQSTTAASISFFEVNETSDWNVSASGWSGTPANGSVAVEGTTISVNVTFTFASYTATFDQSGLEPSAGDWSISVNGRVESAQSISSALVFSFDNDTNASSRFTWAATPPFDYTVTPTGGTFTFNSAGFLVDLTFTSTLGSLTFTGLPASGYDLWINGTEDVVSGNTSTYTQNSLPAGTVTYEIVAGGYYNCFNNATVTGGKTNTVAVGQALIPLPPMGPPGPAWDSLSTLAFLLIAALALVLVLVVAIWLASVGRRPPSAPRSPSEPKPDVNDPPVTPPPG